MIVSRRLELYNPIVGIYELKRFFGLRDLPKSDHRIARVLRYFNNDNEEKMVDVDVTPVKFWENFWCSYSDCVFVDLNEHKHDHTLFLSTSTDKEEMSFMRIDLSYRLKVSNPIKVVESQITDTNSYMKNSLETLVNDSVRYGDQRDKDSVEAFLRKSIATSNSIGEVFSMSDLSVSISYEDRSKFDNQSLFGRQLCNDMNTLLEIAKNSDLEATEEEELKNLILNGPE